VFVKQGAIWKGDSLKSAMNHTITFTTICSQQKLVLSFYSNI